MRDEEALRESINRLHQIIQFLPDATFVIDREGVVIAWNRAIEDLTGVESKDMVGQGNYAYAIPFYKKRRPVMIDLVITDDHSLDHMYAYVKRDKERYESESFIPHLKPGGVYLYNTARALYDTKGNLIGAIESIRDITMQKRAQAQLEESRRQLAQIVDFFPDALLVIDREGRVVAWNRAMEELTGIKADSIIGKGDYAHALPFYAERRPLLADLALSWNEEYMNRYISVRRREDGVLVSESFHPSLRGGIYLSGTARVLHDLHGNPQWAIENLRDITHIKNAEIKLEAARREAEQANVAKSEFLANMSHEIRTPLNGVIGMIRLFADSELTPQQRRYAEVARNSAEALLHIINDILDFSKIEAGRLDLETLHFDLFSLMDDVVATIAVRAQEKGLELICDMDPDVPGMLHGDPGRLRQILTNLTGNAVKFTQAGEVAVRVSVAHQDAESASLHFEVQDSGIGISAERLPLIFDKFTQADTSTTRQYGGTGLGLAISKQLVERMGGWIRVESRLNEGSCFRFSIPFLKQAAGSRSTFQLDPDMKNVRVLILDDSEINRKSLHSRLSAWGMRPLVVADGQSGLIALQEAVEKKDPFQIVLVDHQMPLMNGEDFCRRVKSNARIRHIPLVLLTSMGIRGDAKRFREMGFSGYLTKPVGHSELFDVLNQVMVEKDTGLDRMSTRHSARERRLEARNLDARILLVEDNFTNQQVALGIIERLGMQADAVKNGVEALRALESDTYGLVLMDIQMPEMDGFETTRRIRDPRSTVLNMHVPVIAMTAHALPEDRKRCLEAGMNDYLSKPIDPQVLAEILDRWMPEKETGRPPEEGRAAGPRFIPQKESNALPDFDEAAFMRRVMNDERLGRAVLEGFLKDIPEQMNALKESIAKGDGPAVERQAHTLKGAAANACAERIRRLAVLVEKDGKHGDLESVENHVLQMEAGFKVLLALLEEKIREWGG